MRQLIRVALLGWLVALPAASLGAQSPSLSADVREVRDYKLTIAKVDQFTTAAAALKELATANPATRIEINSGQKQTIDEVVAKLDANPKVKAAIANAKLSTREFVLVQAALLGAMMANAAQQSVGHIPDVASPENIDFVKTNMMAIQEKLRVLATK